MGKVKEFRKNKLISLTPHSRGGGGGGGGGGVHIRQHPKMQRVIQVGRERREGGGGGGGRGEVTLARGGCEKGKERVELTSVDGVCVPGLSRERLQCVIRGGQIIEEYVCVDTA